MMSITETTPIQISDQAAAEAAIRAVVQRLPDGWNRRDSRLWGSAFSDPHDYVAINGFQMLGQTRAANEKMHQQVWEKMYSEGSQISLELTQIRFLTSTIALAHAISHNDFTANGAPQIHDGAISMVLIKTEAEGWLINAFHNGQKEKTFTGHLDD